MQPPNMADADTELIREVYARFGAAYYFSECLHRGLCHGFVLAPFKDRLGVTSPRVEERLAEAYAMTLGQIADAVIPSLPPNLKDQLAEAVRLRNYLAHQFWFEKSNLMFSEDGLRSLIDELENARALFDKVDHDVEAHFAAHRRHLGITDEILEAHLADVAAGEPWTPLHSQRRLRKSETIVRIWDAPAGSGDSTLMFETEDGVLWQLSEVGLGWTKHSQPGPDWRQNALLQPYLPATFNPRPPDSRAWDYEFQLRGRTCLWVRLSPNKANSFVWGLKHTDSSRGT